ncbi:unnamed protein product [Fusarium graminearum]|nr:unnamed protein product [Fusarium graminearum]
MDPVSIIASIAGIATAGAQLSTTLFRVYNTVRHAPREIQSVAIEMSGLSVTLEHLNDILKTGKPYAKPSFFDAVSHVVKNIEATQKDIFKMVNENTMIVRFKWLKAPKYLSEIDKQKVTLTLQISILSAAILVKSKNESSSSLQEKVENRFRLQAESLIQTGQASLQRDNMERRIPQPPPQRAPSPPVRTTKRLPSPVRQSSIPGHVRPDELYGQSSTAGDNLDVPNQDDVETRSALIRHARAQPLPHPHDQSGEYAQGYYDDDREYQTNRGRSEGYDPLAGRVAQFGQHFHLHGDAATFLYNLVFMTEVVQHGKAPRAPSSSGATRGGSNDDPSYYSDELYSDSDSYTDTEGFDKADDSMNHRSGLKIPTRNVYRRPQEPARVVNQLLLAWTSLSQSEIEKNVADEKPTTTQSSYYKNAYVESDDESENEGVKSAKERSNWPHREEDSIPGSPNPSSHQIETPQVDGPRRGTVRPLEQPYQYKYFQPGITAPYDPRMAPNHFSHQQNNHPIYDPWGYPYAVPAWQPLPPTPAPPEASTINVAPQEPPPKESSKPKFQKPHVLVLPHADEADSEIGNMTPKLDISPCRKMSIVRQGEEAVWNSDDYNSKNSIPGKSIMGTLIGDKTARNPHGLDLAHTLIRGQDMKLIYIRGSESELGETWFINEQPVFLQFFHCGYIPQFYPTKESDIKAMKQEYVAVGEEWASFEALNQLGLSNKGREEGRVLLDPNITWSMVKELAITTLQLRSMRQRRLYTTTFYNSIATFREKHCGAIPEPSAVPGYPNSLHHLMLNPQPVLTLEGTKPDAFKFLVKEEAKTEDAARRQTLDTKSTQPQIAVTPPPTPQESSSPEFDTSDMVSTVSTRSRFSRLVNRCKHGRKQSQLSPPLQKHGSRGSDNGTVTEGFEDDDNRPVTPTDSGVGSSIN